MLDWFAKEIVGSDFHARTLTGKVVSAVGLNLHRVRGQLIAADADLRPGSRTGVSVTLYLGGDGDVTELQFLRNVPICLGHPELRGVACIFKLRLSLVVCKCYFDGDIRERMVVGAKRQHAHVYALPWLIQRLVGGERQPDSIGELNLNGFLFAKLAARCCGLNFSLKVRKGVRESKFHHGITGAVGENLLARCWLVVIVVADHQLEIDWNACDRLSSGWVVHPHP